MAGTKNHITWEPHLEKVWKRCIRCGQEWPLKKAILCPRCVTKIREEKDHGRLAG